MTAVLAPNYQEAVLWQAQVSLPARDPGPLPGEADVVVIGGGYCGLSAARALAERGRSVVLLEARTLGWGASTRNGGMVIPELKVGPATLEREYGSLGRRLYAAVNEAFDETEKLIASAGIACDYARSGQLYVAHHRRELSALRSMADEHAEAGEEVRFVGRDDLVGEIGSDAFPGGVVIERTGELHPARFHEGLVALASEAGAALHDLTPALRAERTRSGFRVSTRRGAVEAGDVIVATNAYGDDLLPKLRRRVLPVGSFIIATEPLDADLATAISPRRRMFVDTKNFLFYWRLSPDNRMVFGGRRALGRSSIADARDFLYGAMGRIHPQLRGTPLEFAWGGDVAVTLDRLPHVGTVDSMLYASGCNGTGVALNTWLGSRLAGMVCGDDPPPFAELRHRSIPMWRWRRAYLPLVGAWFRMQDRFGW